MSSATDPYKTDAPRQPAQPVPTGPRSVATQGPDANDAVEDAPDPGPGATPAERRAEGVPAAIGRYRVIRVLGQGGFGRVYLAHDDELDRPVAVKVPTLERLSSQPEDANFRAEARILAQLDHPHIVPVYDVGYSDDGHGYVVSKLISGTDLGERTRLVRPSLRESVELIASLAEALHHAHTRGLVHRDVKPANILIDDAGKAYLADFGLALRDVDFGKGAGLTGTPAYMSPEQARGEGHRVDGRSDIFSLGAVLYELLTGRRPFQADSRRELLNQIVRAEEKPPRQIDDRIPRELERICQKALAKRASQRYSTSCDLADDLRLFLRTTFDASAPAAGSGSALPAAGPTPPAAASPSPQRSDSDTAAVKVVPKGLRSFDEHDADFFLELLPGPRDRDGLPGSIRFWKSRIEELDCDKTFRVGLIYGPSGCGKSSMVRAGLIPRLAPSVRPVYIEATADETETRILKSLHKACPALPERLGLIESLAILRRGGVLRAGQKVVLILDQFEQWLFARRAESDPELVGALRQCDGERVQAIVTVRDDFWMAATRFMQDLEIRLVEGENSAAVDLFNCTHARNVLSAFGRAFGALAEKAKEQSADQKAFLDQSVLGLAQDGKVIPVRLALFAEMVKGKPWTPSTMREVGGTEGVGLAFLEETFSAETAPPEHRLHQKAAQAVLKALLPRTGTEIKGRMRTDAELREASGYADRPRDFNDLIHILDPELRLITPTDPDGVAGDEWGVEGESSGNRPGIAPGAVNRATRHSPPTTPYYQLAHDYLVHSLRDWLTRKQRETLRGRAELRLADRAALWSATRENRHLPSLLEWANITALSSKRQWNEPERGMMRRAGRVHGRSALVVTALIALLTWGGIEGYGTLRASNLVESLQAASTADLPAIIKQFAGYRRWTDGKLRRVLRSSPEASRDHLHASQALLPVDERQVGYLFDRLLTAAPTDLPVIREYLEPHRASLVPRLWSILESVRPGDPKLLPAASSLALYDPQSARWSEVNAKTAEAMVQVNAIYLRPWLDVLQPIRDKLKAPIAALFRDKSRPETERVLATNILTDFVSDDAGLVADLLLDAEPKAYAAFFPIAQAQAEKTLPLFEDELRNDAKIPRTEQNVENVKDHRAERQARAAITLVRMGRAEQIWPLLQHRADPRLRSFIVNWLSPLGADPHLVAAAFNRMDSARIESAEPAGLVSTQFAVPTSGEQPPAESRSSKADAIVFHPETSIRRALILALGSYGLEALRAEERKPLTAKLLDLYRDDPDAGIHGAAAWTLGQWGLKAKLRATDGELSKLKGPSGRRWYVNGQGQTFTVIEGPVEFRGGSPATELDREPDEYVRSWVIPRKFAIASKEVSVEQFFRFWRTEKQSPLQLSPTEFTRALREIVKYSPGVDSAMIGTDWYLAAQYCNWLSEKERIPKDQWCYLPNEGGAYTEGMSIPPDILERTGYRLATDAEWEFACRSGAVTSRYYGVSTEMLGHYARYQANCDVHAWPGGSVMPNDFGLFDMLGNMIEWVNDRTDFFRPQVKGANVDIITKSEVVREKAARIVRGGAYYNPPILCRSAYRLSVPPSARNMLLGFRVARTIP